MTMMNSYLSLDVKYICLFVTKDATYIVFTEAAIPGIGYTCLPLKMNEKSCQNPNTVLLEVILQHLE